MELRVTDTDDETLLLDLLNTTPVIDGVPTDDLADAAGSIGYEILTSLGARYDRRYTDD